MGEGGNCREEHQPAVLSTDLGVFIELSDPDVVSGNNLVKRQYSFVMVVTAREKKISSTLLLHPSLPDILSIVANLVEITTLLLAVSV